MCTYILVINKVYCYPLQLLMPIVGRSPIIHPSRSSRTSLLRYFAILVFFLILDTSYLTLNKLMNYVVDTCCNFLSCTDFCNTYAV